MFYQPNATASELQTFRNLTAVKKDVRAHWLSILRPYQANDGRHTEIQCQEALIHLRDRILENGAHDESSHPSIIYYHLARHFQTVIGWATMTDAEREALSHAMQSLYNLFDLSLNAAQVLIVEVMKATIKDPNLLSRIMAAQLIMTRMANGMMMACGRNVFISMRDKCRKCRKGDIRLMRCGRCRVAYYCSSDCQKADWVSDHKTECPQYVQLIGDHTGNLEAGRHKVQAA